MDKKTIYDAAKKYDIDPRLIDAVAHVESMGSGFDSQGRVKILFERHVFSRLTKHVYDSTHPSISSRTPGGYTRDEYKRFDQAFKLDKEAAMESCSWGSFQIMGFNFRWAGYDSVGYMVDAYKTGEYEQLISFMRFIKADGILKSLKDKDFAQFARRYNGRDYRKNRYDDRIRKAYQESTL